MSHNKHQRLTSSSSLGEFEWQTKCVNTKADGVVRFIKSRHALPYSTSFEKKLYVKRNGDVLEERVCYNTKLSLRNKKELAKLLKLLCETNQGYTDLVNEFFHPWSANTQSQQVKCSEFVRSQLCNVITVATDDDSSEVFLLDKLSCEAYKKFSMNKRTKPKHYIPKANSAMIKSMLFKKKREEISIGRLNLKFTCEKTQCHFFVTVQLYKSDFGVKQTVKDRLKSCLQDSTVTIRRFNLPFPTIIEGEITRQNNLQELLELDIYNWKALGYKFRNSIDESFYKQIRRKNRSLSEV